MRRTTPLAAMIVLAALAFPAAQHGGHQAGIDARGARVMGFDQERTVHHFRLHPDGGAIDVAVKDAADRASLDAIRRHLPHVAAMFAGGSFDAPMLVHGTEVPGTAEMARLKDAIAYRYVETPLGGRVDIVTANAEAIAAIYRFLRFQIADHRTGDPDVVVRRP